MFTAEGDHVPETPFKEVVGKLFGVAFRQYCGCGVKVGVIVLLTVIVMGVGTAH